MQDKRMQDKRMQDKGMQDKGMQDKGMQDKGMQDKGMRDKSSPSNTDRDNKQAYNSTKARGNIRDKPRRKTLRQDGAKPTRFCARRGSSEACW